MLDHPEVLEYNSSDVIDVIKILVEAGDYDIITQEEALLCIARCPDLIKINKDSSCHEYLQMRSTVIN